MNDAASIIEVDYPGTTPGYLCRDESGGGVDFGDTIDSLPFFFHTFNTSSHTRKTARMGGFLRDVVATVRSRYYICAGAAGAAADEPFDAKPRIAITIPTTR